MNTRTENDAIADIVAKHLAAQTLTLTEPADHHETQVVALPSGIQLHSIKKYIDEFRTEPERRQGTASFGDLESFIAHAKRFADTDSAIFANPDATTPTLTSVLDYHCAGSESAPRFGKHRGVYTFPLSEEWEAWTGKDGAGMSQAEFAEWVEGRILDVADGAEPGKTAEAFSATIGCAFASPSKLLELSRGLSIRVGSKVQTAQNLATGEAQFQYVTQHQDESGAPLKVPGAFLVALPVFRNGPLYRLPARLRYRVREGTVTWFYELYRADRVFEHAFKEACDLAKTGTGLPLFVGSPE